MTQLELQTATCKTPGCREPVVGSSITGKGQVCRRCNTAEWGRSLARSREPYYRELGQRLLADSGAAGEQ